MPAYVCLAENVDFLREKQIAEGGFSFVFKARLKRPDLIQQNGGIDSVVLKLFKPIDNMSEEENTVVFNQEVAIMNDVKNLKNFVKFLGYCDQPRSIIMKLYPHGSLFDLIFQRGPLKLSAKEWTSRLILSLLTDVAAALNGIHDREIYHNDLKPDNVFVDRDESGKIYALLADFSMSNVGSAEKLAVKAFKKSHFKGLSMPYAAPELLHQYATQGEQPPTMKQAPMSADVYAFGISAYELLTRMEAWPREINPEELMVHTIQGRRPEWPETIRRIRDSHEIIGTMVSIAERCWVQNALLRPKMGELLRQLARCGKDHAAAAAAAKNGNRT